MIQYLVHPHTRVGQTKSDGEYFIRDFYRVIIILISCPQYDSQTSLNVVLSHRHRVNNLMTFARRSWWYSAA